MIFRFEIFPQECSARGHPFSGPNFGANSGKNGSPGIYGFMPRTFNVTTPEVRTDEKPTTERTEIELKRAPKYLGRIIRR
jgi:hypothetical protein